MQKHKPQSSDNEKSKVGSDVDAARKFGGKKDFGAPESETIEREYASRATKSQDKGAPAAHPTGEGQRVSGAGASAGGPGSASGGDLDPDFIGVGTGGSGIATSGKINEPRGPDDADAATGSPASTSSSPSKPDSSPHCRE
jgi:hypothetical protein